jgi:hypothetical protein
MRGLLKGACVLVVLALSVRAAHHMEAGLDYFADAGSAIDAIVRGDLDGFLADQPLMGSFSLLLRAPFVALVFGGTEAQVFFAGALPCLLATLVLGLVLGRVAADHGQPPAVQGLVAGLAVISPVSLRALHWGHPEELLAGALCVGAVLLALRDRPLLAGLALGLACATKQWALIAVLPVVLSASERRLALLTVAALAALALTVPLLLGNSDSFGKVTAGAAADAPGGAWTTPWNVWWPLAHEQLGPAGSSRFAVAELIARLSHPLIVLLAAPLSYALWRRRERRPEDGLLLLALLFLLRCLLDQWNNDYYHVPLVLSVLAWETLRREGFPWLTLALTALVAITFPPDFTRIFGDSAARALELNVLYLAWALPLAAGLALELYAPGGLRTLPQNVRGALARV